jgi:deoxyribodipyrimidine photo-lyase
LLLHEPEAVLKKDGLPYMIYTPFYRQANQLFVKKPQKLPDASFYTKPISLENAAILNHYVTQFSKPVFFAGGRKAGLKNLSMMKDQENYSKNRDFPAQNSGSHLSAHHKFGTVSIRESFYDFSDAVFQRELYWRDFFTHIAFHFPRVFSGCFHEKYNQIAWENNENHFEKWCTGQTGFPLVDAGMRELNETGYMHNRVRMVVASFLVKDLHIDWHWGEKYFAQKLIDYDPAVNNGNWQWAASTGCDAQPYFRIFNPLLQQKRFDPDLAYVQQWVPEFQTSSYPQPMIDHAEMSAIAKSLFQEIK